jgi:uncharacterized FlaG/YvyC family protein
VFINPLAQQHKWQLYNKHKDTNTTQNNTNTQKSKEERKTKNNSNNNNNNTGESISVNAMKLCKRSRGINAVILNLVTSSRWVDITPQALYYREIILIPLE